MVIYSYTESFICIQIFNLNFLELKKGVKAREEERDKAK